jgi:hypothetical protein
LLHLVPLRDKSPDFLSPSNVPKLYRECIKDARRLGERGGQGLYAAQLPPARQFVVSTSNKSRLVVAKKPSSFPLFVWSPLRIHQMLTVMVDIRSCDSSWHRDGEAVYCAHGYVSSSTCRVICTTSKRRHSAWEVGRKLKTRNIADSRTPFWRLEIGDFRKSA